MVIEALKTIDRRRKVTESPVRNSTKKQVHRMTKVESDHLLMNLMKAWPSIPKWKRKVIRLQVSFYVFSAKFQKWKNQLCRHEKNSPTGQYAESQSGRGRR